MDSISKKILIKTRNASNKTVLFIDDCDPFQEIAQSEVIDVSIKHLIDTGYLDTLKDAYTGNTIGVTLTHKSLYPVNFKIKVSLKYLFDNWIAIVALIISIIALAKQ